MGHGPGPAMRAALVRLNELDAGQPWPQWHSVYEIAGPGVSRPTREALRQALKRLHSHGQVELMFKLGPLGSRGRMGQLHARLAAPDTALAKFRPAEPAEVG